MAGMLYLISVWLCEFNPNSTPRLLVWTFHFCWGMMLLSLIYRHIFSSNMAFRYQFAYFAWDYLTGRRLTMKNLPLIYIHSFINMTFFVDQIVIEWGCFGEALHFLVVSMVSWWSTTSIWPSGFAQSLMFRIEGGLSHLLILFKRGHLLWRSERCGEGMNILSSPAGLWYPAVFG